MLVCTVGVKTREEFFNVLVCTVGVETGEEFFNVLFCTVAWNGGGGETEGRLSASATTFCGPGICLTSVVNSEMYAICRTCLEDQSGDTRFMA